jgi:hypothetical protein
MLRRGNHASAKFWRRVLLPVIERYRHLDIPKFFRGDAEMAVTRKLFAAILDRIERLALPPPAINRG